MGLNSGPPALEASTLPLGYRGGGFNCIAFDHLLLSLLQEFLSKLSKPLTVPDDKITRWHPKFPLDEVADIPEALLPQPPNVQVYQTAKDVLEGARGKLTPKVKVNCRLWLTHYSF